MIKLVAGVVKNLSRSEDAGDAEPAGGSALEVPNSTSCWDAGVVKNPQEVPNGW